MLIAVFALGYETALISSRLWISVRWVTDSVSHSYFFLNVFNRMIVLWWWLWLSYLWRSPFQNEMERINGFLFFKWWNFKHQTQSPRAQQAESESQFLPQTRMQIKKKITIENSNEISLNTQTHSHTQTQWADGEWRWPRTREAHVAIISAVLPVISPHVAARPQSCGRAAAQRATNILLIAHLAGAHAAGAQRCHKVQQSMK